MVWVDVQLVARESSRRVLRYCFLSTLHDRDEKMGCLDGASRLYYTINEENEFINQNMYLISDQNEAIPRSHSMCREEGVGA